MLPAKVKQVTSRLQISPKEKQPSSPPMLKIVRVAVASVFVGGCGCGCGCVGAAGLGDGLSKKICFICKPKLNIEREEDV